MASNCQGSGQGGQGGGPGRFPQNRPTSANNNNNNNAGGSNCANNGNISGAALMRAIMTIEEDLENAVRQSEWRAGQEASLLQNLGLVQQERQQVDLVLQSLRGQRQQYHQEFCRRYCINEACIQQRPPAQSPNGNIRPWNEVAASPPRMSFEERSAGQGAENQSADNVEPNNTGRDRSLSNFVQSEPWQRKE